MTSTPPSPAAASHSSPTATPAPQISVGEAVARFEASEAYRIESNRIIMELRAQITDLQTKLDARGSFKNQEFRLVDPKTVTPENV